MADRPVRNLAAWGYHSASSGTRVEIDVWTVNERDSGTLPDPSELDGGGNVEEVIRAAGNVVEVEYHGAAGTGYRYIDMSKTNPGKDSPTDATQQAFAGAARAGGGPRTQAGTFSEGGGSAVIGPDIDAVRAHAEEEVMPEVREELGQMGLGGKIGRTPSNDEVEEEVESAPFSGFKNVVRVFPRGGDVWRYRVEGGHIDRESKPEGVGE